jgi:CxxC-x17-CxxC domain-containing protein
LEVVRSVYRDQTLSCVDCSREFTFTAGEQEFYAQKGFTEPPKRCPSCRSARKAQRGSPAGVGAGSSSFGGGGGYSDSGYGSASGGYGDSGGYSSRGSYSSGGGGGYSSGGGGGGYGERRPRQMFDATCANCGKAAQVPFQPTGSRPVYCSDCFQTRRG